MSLAPDGVKVVPNIEYREGHPRWKLDLAMPSAKATKPRPAIVFVHGGGWKNGDKRRGYFLQGALEYAAKGYVCITVNYRLTQTAPFPGCVEDVKNAVRWLRAHANEYGVDSERIGAYGNSAGGHLVLMLGLVPEEADLEGDGTYLDQPSQVQAVFASVAPTDFPNWPKGLGRFTQPNGLLSGTEGTVEERAAKASPISYVSKDMPPIYLVYGSRDGLVQPSQGESFVKAAKEAGAEDIEMKIYEGAGHGAFTQHQDETHPAMEKFFERTLRGD